MLWDFFYIPLKLLYSMKPFRKGFSIILGLNFLCPNFYGFFYFSCCLMDFERKLVIKPHKVVSSKFYESNNYDFKNLFIHLWFRWNWNGCRNEIGHLLIQLAVTLHQNWLLNRKWNWLFGRRLVDNDYRLNVNKKLLLTTY